MAAQTVLMTAHNDVATIAPDAPDTFTASPRELATMLTEARETLAEQDQLIAAQADRIESLTAEVESLRGKLQDMYTRIVNLHGGK